MAFVLVLPVLDLTDTAGIRAVLASAFRQLGRIDVLVSNAGYGLPARPRRLPGFFQKIPRLLRIQNLNFPLRLLWEVHAHSRSGISFPFTACCKAERRTACVNRTARADRPRSCMFA